MNIKTQPQEGRDLIVGAAISITVHFAVILALLLYWAIAQITTEEEELAEEQTIEVVLEELDDDLDMEVELDPKEFAQAEIDAPEKEKLLEREEELEEEKEEELLEETLSEEEVEEEEQEAMDPLDDTLLERYAVDQKTNEEEVLDAEHISDQAHRTDEEMIADITTLEDVPIEEEDLEAPLIEAETELEIAMSATEEPLDLELVEPQLLEEWEESLAQELVEEDQEEQQKQEESLAQEPKKYLDPSEMINDPGELSPQPEPDSHRALFGHDPQRAERLFAQDEQEAAQRQGPEGRRLLARWRENEESLRASLENFLPHIQTGNHTSVNARAAAHASYIARIHRRIHANWALRFLPSLQSTYSNAHPLNNMNLSTVVEIVIDAHTGEVLETGRVIPSGNTLFDGEALLTAREIGVHPDPPPAIVSPDDKIYIHWTFWRDQRQCGSFGVRIYRLQGEGEQRIIHGEEFGGEHPL